MSVIYIALPIALLLAALALTGFIWSVRQGQLDDLQSPAWRILENDDPPRPGNASVPAGEDSEN